MIDFFANTTSFFLSTLKYIPNVYHYFLRQINYRKLVKYLKSVDYPPFLYGPHLFNNLLDITEEDTKKLLEWGKPAIKYLLEDQLPNGFWSKTGNWGHTVRNQPISRSGASTATFNAIEALIYGSYDKLSLLPNKNNLLNTINLITDNIKGKFIRHGFERSAGGDDIEYERLAHNSANFIIRQILVQMVENIDDKIINNIADDITPKKIENIKKYDASLLIKSFLSYMYHAKYIKTTRYIKKLHGLFRRKYIYYFNKVLTNSAMMFLPNSSTNKEQVKDIFQWINIYSLIPILDIYLKIGNKQTYNIFDEIKALLVTTPILENSSIYCLCLRLITTFYISDKIENDNTSDSNLKIKPQDDIKRIIDVLIKKDLAGESLVFDEKKPEDNMCINFVAVTLLLNVLGYKGILPHKPSESIISEKYEEALLIQSNQEHGKSFTN